MANEEELMKFFDDCDADGSGEITLSELKNAFRDKQVDEEALESYLNSFDRDQDGKISREEYQRSLGLFPPGERQAMAWRGVFESFDANGSGKIGRDELDAVLRDMHGGPHGYNAEALQRFLSQHDADGDSELDYNEFLRWIRHNPQ